MRSEPHAKRRPREAAPAGACDGPADGYRLRRAGPADRARPRRRRSDGLGEQPRPIGEVLLAAGLIDREQLSWALARQAETGERVGQILLAAGHVHRLELQKALGEQWGVPFIDLLETDIDEQLVREFDADLLLSEGWVPVRWEGNRLIVATCEPPAAEQRRRILAHLPPRTRVNLRTTTP